MKSLEFEGQLELVNEKQERLTLSGEQGGLHLELPGLALLWETRGAGLAWWQQRAEIGAVLQQWQLPIRVTVAQQEVINLEPALPPNWIARQLCLPYGHIHWRTILTLLLP